VVIRVDGESSLAPVVPDLRFGDERQPVTPVAVTNPIWVEIPVGSG
jgi:hypothetical protein